MAVGTRPNSQGLCPDKKGEVCPRLRFEEANTGGSRFIHAQYSEGFDSETNPEFIRFLRYAKRSCTEVQSELYVAMDQQYITKPEFQDVYDHAARTRAAIRGFIKYLLAYERSQGKKGNPER